MDSNNAGLPCDCPPGMSRRQFLSLGGVGGAALLEAWSPLVQAIESLPVAEQQEWGDTPVVLREGTNLAITCSPDAQRLAMDLQGVLWVMPISGGRARRLTGYLHDIARPHWSPDGRSIVFQSYRDGSFQLWMVSPDGSDLRQITAGEFDCREPRFSPDGKALAFASDRSGHYAIHVLDLRSGSVRMLADTGMEDGEPAWSPDGTRIAFSSGGRICSVAARTPNGSVRVEFAGPGASAPEWSPDGIGLSYRVLEGKGRDLRSSRLFFQGNPLTDLQQDVFPVPVVWTGPDRFLYTADGKIFSRGLASDSTRSIPFEAVLRVTAKRALVPRKALPDTTERPVKGISFPALSPDGNRIVFGALNQLWLLDMAGGKPRQLTDESYAKIGPVWSPDGKKLAYASDREGFMQLCVHDLETGVARVLTHEQAGLKFPAWSPDSRRIACHTHDGWLCVADLATGSLHRLVRQTAWSGRASWSPDGQYLALAAVRPYSARYREGLSAFMVVRVEDGSTRYESPEPGVSLDARSVNGPLWSADGRHFFYTMKGRLWASPVSAEGHVSGPPVALNDEASDALSLSADCRTLLYLNNGRLRLMRLNGLRKAALESLDAGVSWRPAAPSGTIVVHAGRFWDGRSEHLREGVDVVIQAGRILSVEVHRADRPGVQWVDARAQTVMPGLMDMHTHREMGIQFGDREPRIFLAYGITTTRGLGENAYLMLENKESVAAGQRVGPRHFGTGEALDGRRVFYDGMHAVADEKQLAREFERALALDYDLIKCYVRLPPDLQAKATRMAHEIGLPITSHYLFPAVAFGADGYEHMGGTSRFGYSRTGSTLGGGYQDVIALTTASGGFRTPTLFGLENLLAETPEEVFSDPRIQTLFPAWERAALEGHARGKATGPLPAVVRQMDAVMAMQKAGAKVICGSDYPIVAPGLSLHLNLRAMVQCGMRPVDALRTATSVAGDVLARGHGALEPGALADLIIVNGNPLARIEDAARVESVMVGGVIHSLASLIAPFEGKSSGRTAMDAGTLPLLSALPEQDHWWHDPHWVHAVQSSCCNPTV